MFIVKISKQKSAHKTFWYGGDVYVPVCIQTLGPNKMGPFQIKIQKNFVRVLFSRVTHHYFQQFEFYFQIKILKETKKNLR